MKKLMAVSMLTAIAASAPALAADVGVSINVGEPGFYGQIDIGNVPRPVVVNPRPIIIQPAPVAVEPIYLRVPPGQAKKWSYYCGRYNACGRPVYFVQDNWYQTVYAPEYRRQHAEKFRRDHDRDDDRRGHDEHRDHDDHDHGNGQGRDKHRG